MTVTESSRADEIAKYEHVYLDPGYGMGLKRQQQADALLGDAPPAAECLDVGCGRGETQRLALDRGYIDWVGVECVESLLREKVVRGRVWSVPFPNDSFHTVCCFDVLEHVLPGDAETVGDDQLCVLELLRIARCRVLLTIGLGSSRWGNTGPELHINLRTPEEWTALLRDAAGAEWEVRRREALDVDGINAAWELVRVP